MGKQKVTRLCHATTKAGEQCKKYVKDTQTYCCRHAPSPIAPVKPPALENDNQEQSFLGTCAICLDEVADEDDCGLLCHHPHHQACILQLRGKLECPVCRASLLGSKLNQAQLEKITVQQQEGKRDDIQAQIENDAQEAQRLHDEESRRLARRLNHQLNMLPPELRQLLGLINRQ